MPFRILKNRLASFYHYWVITSLIILAAIFIGIRLLLSSGEGIPANDRVYTLSYTVNFNAQDTKSFIQLALPDDTPFAHVIAQHIENPGMRIERRKSQQGNNRELLAYATSAGEKNLLAEFTIQVSPIAQRKPGKAELTPEQRERYLASTDDIDTESHEVIAALKDIEIDQQDKENLITQIFSYVNNKIISDNTVNYDDAASVLRSQRANNLGRARAMVALCRAARIPARIVTGFVLKDTINVTELYWVQAYIGKRWVPYDPENGFSDLLPADYIPASKGSTAVLAASDITASNITYDINEQFYPVGKLNRQKKSISDIMDLSRLSLDARNALALLLLLPLGALFTTFCTNIINIRTYGTFTPTLLALAARYADLTTTIVIFIIVAVTGLLGQAYMPDKMSRIPRLTIVMTVVAMSMTLGVSFMDYFSLSPDGRVLLLPIVILTSLVDRLYKTLDEDGIHIAMVRLVWTAIVGSGCYFILLQEQLGQLILSFPEIHLITIALVILLANYKYRKLSDLRYFSWVAEPRKSRPTAHTKTPAG